MTKSLVIGAGSIGMRHAEVLATLESEVAFVSGRNDLEVPTFLSIYDAIDQFQPDYVILANETAKHSTSFNQLMQTGYSGRLLIEKPASIERKDFETSFFSSVRVAYNLRFHPVLRSLRKEIQGKKVLSVQAYVGQDLSSWRPGRSLGSQYSAFADQGGGVLRDLSHELDYLQWIFGKAHLVTALGGRIGQVTVDSDDSWSIIFTTEITPQVSLSMNYLDFPGARNIRVLTDEATIIADFISGTVSINGREISKFTVPRNETYSSMHKDVLGDGLLSSSIENALEIDQLILDIERSSSEKIWIRR